VKDLQTIEKAIIKKYRKEIYSKVVRAIKDFDLIEENDKIAVCISGGKDSFLMAKCMQEIKRHNKIPFELKFIVMDPGYDIKVLEHIRKLASDNISFAREIRPRSPPLKSFIRLNTSSPVNKKAARTFRMRVLSRFG